MTGSPKSVLQHTAGHRSPEGERRAGRQSAAGCHPTPRGDTRTQAASGAPPPLAPDRQRFPEMHDPQGGRKKAFIITTKNTVESGEGKTCGGKGNAKNEKVCKNGNF